MQQNASDHENCLDVQIWTKTGSTHNNGARVLGEMSLVDKWMTDPNFASSIQNGQNLPSTSKEGSTAWHEVWNPESVERHSSDQVSVYIIKIR